MFNAVEFTRRPGLKGLAPNPVSINPRFVATVAPANYPGEQETMTTITMSNGMQFTVQAPPSEVTRRLRAGV